MVSNRDTRTCAGTFPALFQSRKPGRNPGEKVSMAVTRNLSCLVPVPETGTQSGRERIHGEAIRVAGGWSGEEDDLNVGAGGDAVAVEDDGEAVGRGGGGQLVTALLPR
jgi:hypothetical protein